MNAWRRALFTLTILAAALPASPAAGQNPAESAIAEGDYAAAVDLLRRDVAAAPDDEMLRFRLAQVLGWDGRHGEALGEYDALVAASPSNVDYVFGRAQALAGVGREREAMAEARRARDLAPDYEAVWQLEYRLARRVLSVGEIEALRELVASRFPDAGWWREPRAAPDYSATLTAGTSRDELSGDRPGWRRYFARLEGETRGGIRYLGEVARDRRFDGGDNSLTIGGGRDFGTDWSLDAALAISPDARSLPEAGISAELRRRFPAGWGGWLGVRRRDYDTATVTTWRSGAERYVGDYRLAYSLDVSRLHGSATSLTHVLSLAWYPRDGHALGLGFATGEEAESVGPSRVIETDVESVTLSGRHAIGGRYVLNWWLGTQDQGDIYRRHYAGLALGYRL